MKRLCILGNSHVAALATGWQAVETRYPNVRVTFFAAPRDMMGDLKVQNGVLVADDALGAKLAAISGGPSCVDPKDYDVFWVCGFGLSINQALLIAADYAPESLSLGGGRIPVSDACFTAAVVGSIEKTNAWQLVNKLKAVTDKPISVLLAPMPSEDALSSTNTRYSALQSIVEHGGGQALSDLFDRASSTMETDQVRFEKQPGTTLAGPILSLSRFSRGSVRLRAEFDRPHPVDDFAHMNADYGVEVFAAFLGAGLEPEFQMVEHNDLVSASA